MVGNSFAQLRQALRLELPFGVTLAAAQGVIQAAAPLVERELRLARCPADKVIARGRLQLALGEHGGALLPAFEGCGTGQGNAGGLMVAQWLARGDERATADHAAEQVVVGQP
ncbi:hypothetical protein D3C81_1489880 [compost metagenome]